MKIFKSFLTLWMLLFAAPAWAVLATGNAAGTYSNGAGSLDFSVDCTGANRALIVGVSANHINVATSVTHNSVALTKIAESAQTGYSASLWKLSNPDTGSQNIHIVSDGFVIAGVALCFTGAHQTTGSLTGTAATSTAGSGVSVSSASGEIVIDIATSGDGIGSCTGSGQGLVNAAYDSSNLLGAFVSVEAGAGSVTMDWSCGTVAAQVGVSVKPASAPPATGKGGPRRRIQ